MDNHPTGAVPHMNQASASNGEENNHNNHPNQQAGGDAGNHGMTSPPVEVRPNPAPPALPPYPGGGVPGALYGVGGAPVGVGGAPVGVGGAPPYGYLKPMWYATPHGPQPAPPNINVGVARSVHVDGSDLPLHDLATVRFFFNLGLDCMWSSLGAPPPPPQAQPPRLAYPPRDLAQDMQQMSIQERPAMSASQDMNHKKPPSADKLGAGGGGGGGCGSGAKGNGQRTVVGPRFKRNDNNHNGNHSNHSNHNNHHNQKGRNNNGRRNSDRSGGNGQQLVAAHPHPHPHSHPHAPPHHPPPPPPPQYPPAEPDAAPEQPMMSMPYHIAYPPPIYPPMQYYAPIEPDHGMLGIMPYYNYEEGLEYAPPAYYPPAPPPPHFGPPPAAPPHAGMPPPPPHNTTTPDNK